MTMAALSFIWLILWHAAILGPSKPDLEQRAQEKPNFIFDNFSKSHFMSDFKRRNKNLLLLMVNYSEIHIFEKERFEISTSAFWLWGIF